MEKKRQSKGRSTTTATTLTDEDRLVAILSGEWRLCNETEIAGGHFQCEFEIVKYFSGDSRGCRNEAKWRRSVYRLDDKKEEALCQKHEYRMKL